MDREQNSGKEHGKHISMELFADGARVTNLSLEGNRLILTIEAELADSHVHASESAQPAPAAKAKQPRSDTEIVERKAAPSSPTGMAMPALGDALPEGDVMADSMTGGSEAFMVPPPAAPQAAPASPRISERLTVHQQAKNISLDDATAFPGFVANPPQQPKPQPTAPIPAAPMAPTPAFGSSPVPAGQSISIGDGEFDAVEEDVQSLELDDTLELTSPGTFAQADEPWQAPAASAPAPTAEPSREITLGDDPFPPLESQPVPPPPAAPGKELRLGGDISLGDDLSVGQWGGGQAKIPAAPHGAPQPMMETWDPSSLALGGAPEPLAISEESSALGGERHGEPQPAMSFGLDAPAQPSVQPAHPAPAQEQLPGISLGFDAPAAPAPAAPAPAPAAPGISVGGTPGFGFDAPAPVPTPAPTPAPGISLGGAPGISLGDNPGFGFDAPAPAPAPAPGIGLGGAPGISLGDDPGLGFDSPAPTPAPAPGISLGGAPGISLGDDPVLGFGSPAPSPAPAPGISLGGAPGISMGDDPGIGFDTPTPGLGLEPPVPEASPLTLEPAPAAPKGTPAQEAPTLPNLRPPEAEKPAAKQQPSANETKGEGGSTTVLIRYTCPKCKTQGMQAVDKVGTVVNCSNCGKAMRLVMKK